MFRGTRIDLSHRGIAGLGALVLIVALVSPVLAYQRPGRTERVSVTSDGAEGDRWSESPSTSADGRHVAFVSPSSNLVPGDTNGFPDVFVHDRVTRATDRVSVNSQGEQANGLSVEPSADADGRRVAFSSSASNLVPGDTNDVGDVFVHDRATGTTELVSVASDGTQGNAESHSPSISADGRHVAFVGFASNLVPDDTNGVRDVFVHDRVTSSTERVSVASDGAEGDGFSYRPTISADGRYVAFVSAASNLVPGDTNGVMGIYVHDRANATTERVSVASSGAQANSTSEAPSISADGRHVAFWSFASNLVPGDTNGTSDVFVHDRATGTTERVSVASDGTEEEGHSVTPSISADGRYVAYVSSRHDVFDDLPDIFVHDRATGATERISVALDGTESNGSSWAPSISADGRHVAFVSGASNLVPSDTNSAFDVFVRDRGPATGVGSLAAQQAGASDEDLADVFDLQRKAMWRLDFISSENSRGFHADQETARILAESIDYSRQAQAGAIRLQSPAAAEEPASGP
jgi:Tol biopolymer transport system component